MYFRPESMGTFGGGEPLDGPGTDFAIKFVRATWRYHEITAARLHEDLAGLPAKIAHIEQLAADGVIGGEQPNAADFQIGATIRVLLPIGDLAPLLNGTAAQRIALSCFPAIRGACRPAPIRRAGCRRLSSHRRGLLPAWCPGRVATPRAASKR